jgi:hypothetical protein
MKGRQQADTKVSFAASISSGPPAAEGRDIEIVTSTINHLSRG